MSLVDELARVIAPYAFDRAPGHLSLMQAGRWRDKAQANARASADAMLRYLQANDYQIVKVRKAVRPPFVIECDVCQKPAQDCLCEIEALSS